MLISLVILLLSIQLLLLYAQDSAINANHDLEVNKPVEIQMDLEEHNDFLKQCVEYALSRVHEFDRFEQGILTDVNIENAWLAQHIFDVERVEEVERVVQVISQSTGLPLSQLSKGYARVMKPHIVFQCVHMTLNGIYRKHDNNDNDNDNDIEEVIFDNNNNNIINKDDNNKDDNNSNVPVRFDLAVTVDLEGVPSLSHYRITHLNNEYTCPFRQQTNNQHIDILSVNIWNYNYWPQRIPILKSLLLHLSPDVIGFQEVRSKSYTTRRGSRSQVEELGVILEGQYEYIYQPAMGFNQDSDEYHMEGLALFSRYPILEYKPIYLSKNTSDEEDFHQRLCLSAIIGSPLGNITVLVTHLTLSDQARERSLNEIGMYATEVETPVILLGDMNTEFKEGNVLINNYNFKDSFDNDDNDNDDNDNDDNNTFPSWNPSKRIDYILYNGKDMITSTRSTVEGKESIKMNGLRPIGGVENFKGVMYPSDHYFPYVRFEKKTSSNEN